MDTHIVALQVSGGLIAVSDYSIFIHRDDDVGGLAGYPFKLCSDCGVFVAPDRRAVSVTAVGDCSMWWYLCFLWPWQKVICIDGTMARGPDMIMRRPHPTKRWEYRRLTEQERYRWSADKK